MPAGFPVVGPEWPSMNSLLLGDERVQTSPEVALGGMPRPTDQREIKCGVQAGLRGDDRGNRVDDPPRTRGDRRIGVIAQRAGFTDVHYKVWFADDLDPVGPAFLCRLGPIGPLVGPQSGDMFNDERALAARPSTDLEPHRGDTASWYASGRDIELLCGPIEFAGIRDLIHLDAQAGTHCTDGRTPRHTEYA